MAESISRNVNSRWPDGRVHSRTDEAARGCLAANEKEAGQIKDSQGKRREREDGKGEQSPAWRMNTADGHSRDCGAWAQENNKT